MGKLPIYLSAPSVKNASNTFSNEDIINKGYKNFRGSKSEWKKIKTGISFVFRYCDSQERFHGLEKDKMPIDYVVEVAKNVCGINGITHDKIDLLIYGGIYRTYFEPATSMEIAAKLGLGKVLHLMYWMHVPD